MSAPNDQHDRAVSPQEEAAVPRASSLADSDLARTSSGTLSASLELDFEQMFNTVLVCLASWVSHPPAASDVQATHDTVSRAQVSFLADLRRAREAQQRLIDHEKELKTQVANLWQNNATLEKEMRYLAGELDLTQRKCRTLERALDKQSGKFQAERDGLVQGTRGHQTAIQQLEVQIRELSDQLAERERLLHTERQGHRKAAAVAKLNQLEASEATKRHSVVTEFHEGLRLISAQALRGTWVPPQTAPVRLLTPVGRWVPPQTAPVRLLTPVGSPSRVTYPLIGDGAKCALAFRHEQAQRLSETLTALRLRIEGALEACAADGVVGLPLVEQQRI